MFSHSYGILVSLRLSTHQQRMSLISRLGLHMSNGFSKKSLFSTPLASKALLLNNRASSRYYAQPALQEEEEEELEMVDQRRLPTDYDPATFDPTEHRSPPTKRVFRLVDEVTGLTLVEIQQLSMIMRKKLSMKEQVMVAVMKAGAAAGFAGLGGKGAGAEAVKEEKKVEKTVFELKLEAFEAASKIKIIKEVRSFTDLGLKEAKDLVEKTPAVIKTGVSKEEAEKIIEKMKALGAKVVME